MEYGFYMPWPAESVRLSVASRCLSRQLNLSSCDQNREVNRSDMWPICKCLLVLPLFGTGETNLQIWYIGTYVDHSNSLLSLQMTNIRQKARTGKLMIDYNA